MRITEVELTLFAWEGIPPVEFNSRLANRSGRSELGLLRIATDEGATGEAFLGSTMRKASLDAQALVERLKPLLMGADPLERERLYQAMHAQPGAGALMRAIGCVDMALWDLAGKLARQPVHRLLGSFRSAIPAYASSPLLPSPEAYAEQALQCRVAGYPAYKVHGVEDAARDIAICTAVRRALGDDYVLMLDSSFAYSYEDALEVGKALQALGFRWLEDPLGELDIDGYQRLCAALDIPVMATELPVAGFAMYAPWLERRASDHLRGDALLKGGITTMVKTAHLAEAFGLNYEIHHGGNSIGNLASLQVALAIPNCEYFEVILPEKSHRYGLLREPELDRGGKVHAPAGAGLGAEIDYDLVRRNRIAVLA